VYDSDSGASLHSPNCMIVTLAMKMHPCYLGFDGDSGADPAQPQLEDVMFALDEDGPMVPGV
jgi:hypothetical protein